jgi:hypothetical protein
MALLTVNALARELLREQDEATDNSEMISVVESWIDDAIDEIADAYDWKFFQQVDSLVTVASQQAYALAENVVDIRSIRFIDTDEPIDYQDIMNLTNIAENFEIEGKPRFWFYLESTTGTNEQIKNIGFVPIPDAVYSLKLHVQVHPTTTALGTNDNIPFRKEMILAIKHRVRAYILMNDKDYEGARFYLQAFYNKLEEMKAKETRSPAAKYLVMQPRDLGSQSDRRFAGLDPSHFSR